MQIRYNSSLSTISGFANVVNIYSLFITDNASLTNISGFVNVRTITLNIEISNNDANLQMCKTAYDAMHAAAKRDITVIATINNYC